jgi:hypothetical protein
MTAPAAANWQELEARSTCRRCAAHGTHYLTCPTLQLPAAARPRPRRWTPAYTDGQIIAYASRAPSGWSRGQVVNYAPEREQYGLEQGGPLVYIRAQVGGQPFPIREDQLRPLRPRPDSPGQAAPR